MLHGISQQHHLNIVYLVILWIGYSHFLSGFRKHLGVPEWGFEAYFSLPNRTTAICPCNIQKASQHSFLCHFSGLWVWSPFALTTPWPSQPLSWELPVAVGSLDFLGVSLAKETPWSPSHSSSVALSWPNGNVCPPACITNQWRQSDSSSMMCS